MIKLPVEQLKQSIHILEIYFHIFESLTLQIANEKTNIKNDEGCSTKDYRMYSSDMFLGSFVLLGSAFDKEGEENIFTVIQKCLNSTELAEAGIFAATSILDALSIQTREIPFIKFVIETILKLPRSSNIMATALNFVVDSAMQLKHFQSLISQVMIYITHEPSALSSEHICKVLAKLDRHSKTY